eukprot:COSAG04_NODE_2162_length_4649_cov_8.389231_4_plen_179_part_00
MLVVALADADVEAEGCWIEGGTYNCQRVSDGTDNGRCASELALTVTTGAFFDKDSASATPTVGSATLTGTTVLGKAELEAQAAAMFAATPPEQRRLAAPPTLEEMLVGGSEAAAMLGRLFTVQQEPHVVYPLSFAPVASLDGGGSSSHGKGGHRRCASSLHFLGACLNLCVLPQAAGR